MYSKILVPLDGSTTAECALPMVRSLARRLAIPVELLGVIDLREISRTVSAAEALFLDRLLEDQSRRSAEYLGKIAKTLSGMDVKTRDEQGEAAEVIVETAAADKNTLIVMATHGRSGLNRFLLGSIAEKVLRARVNPLLLVKANEPDRYGGRSAVDVDRRAIGRLRPGRGACCRWSPSWRRSSISRWF